jgi:hypothetical protein
MEPIKPESIKDLENPFFLAWAKAKVPWPVQPDEQDYDSSSAAATDKEAAHQYRIAQARKLMRLYGEWKASLS